MLGKANTQYTHTHTQTSNLEKTFYINTRTQNIWIMYLSMCVYILKYRFIHQTLKNYIINYTKEVASGQMAKNSTLQS